MLDGQSPSTPAFYSVQLEETLNEDVNFISNDPLGANSTEIELGTIVNIYKYKVENKPQFDGRFFVKIHEDEVFIENIGKSIIEGLEYRVTASKKVYLMKNSEDHINLHYKRYLLYHLSATAKLYLCLVCTTLNL
jgi:hypothetical protein